MDTVELVAVIPVYNEEEGLGAVISEWSQAFAAENINCRLLVINDGSTDATMSILQKLESQLSGQLVVFNKTNSGHGRTCRFGYEAALEQGAPWILQIDSDGQCDPAFFAQFWAKRDKADCVFGERVTRDDGISRTLISKACRLLTAVVARCDLKDVNVPYRLIERRALQRALPKIPADFDLQNVALTLALKRDHTLRWSYVPIRFRARRGAHRLKFGEIVKMGWRMLTQINRVAK